MHLQVRSPRRGVAWITRAGAWTRWGHACEMLSYAARFQARWGRLGLVPGALRRQVLVDGYPTSPGATLNEQVKEMVVELEALSRPEDAENAKLVWDVLGRAQYQAFECLWNEGRYCRY